MQRNTTQQLHAMTQDEQREYTRQIRAPMARRGHLHLPKQKYFAGLYGQNILAHDLSRWLALDDMSVQVVEHDKTQWTLDYTSTSATISLPRDSAQQNPFAAHYMIVLAVCTLAAEVRLPRNFASGESEQHFIEHLAISVGFGVYGVNARHSAPKHQQHGEYAIPAQHYQELFQEYCRKHTIPLPRYEQHLLPVAQHALHTHSPKNSHKTFIQRYLRTKKARSRRAFGYTISIIIMLLAIILLWHYVPQPLSREQRNLQTNIEILRQEYENCQRTLENMRRIATEPDVLRTRSLQLQLRQCEELKQTHNQLVSVYNQSL